MERYEIWKNGRLFAGFHEGDPSRFGEPFSRDIAMREFNSCLGYWESWRGENTWELRMIIPPPEAAIEVAPNAPQLEGHPKNIGDGGHCRIDTPTGARCYFMERFATFDYR